MLNKIFNCKFSKSVFSWGYNKHNCGYSIHSLEEGAKPFPLVTLEKYNILKSVSGYSESLLLLENGKVFQFGLDRFLQSNN